MEQELCTVYVPDSLTDDEYSRFLELWAVKEKLEERVFSDNAVPFRTNGKIYLSGIPMDMLTSSQFYLGAMVDYAKRVTRVNSRHADTEGSEKYAFRTWLNRIGLKGPAYKQVRKELMHNLTGSASRAH